VRYALFEILGMVKVHEDLKRTSELIVFFPRAAEKFCRKRKNGHCRDCLLIQGRRSSILRKNAFGDTVQR